MNTRMDWREAVCELPVFDTHTHMNNPGVPIGAQTVWDIVHYFWFQQELWSVGYPQDPMALDEDARVDRFVAAFEQVRNTTWALIVRETIRRFYGVELGDATSIRDADQAVRAKAADPDWPRSVIDQLNIKRITVNHEKCADFPGLPGVGAALPIWPEIKDWTKRIAEADDQQAAAEQAEAAAMDYVAAIAGRGCRGMRVNVPPFDGHDQQAIQRAVQWTGPLPAQGASDADIQTVLVHALFKALSKQGLFAQLFLGIGKMAGMTQPMAIDDPRRIVNLYPLFDRYECDFELVAGAPGHNMDVAQAARIFPTVHAGGLWWYNFRPSTYRQALQVRLEAVPASKSVIVASDGRCIEWCYAKTLLVKWLVADFLHEQVQGGWISQADAMWVARQWFHDAAEQRYCGQQTLSEVSA
jgi:hypothetical protein